MSKKRLVQEVLEKIIKDGRNRSDNSHAIDLLSNLPENEMGFFLSHEKWTEVIGYLPKIKAMVTSLRGVKGVGNWKRLGDNTSEFILICSSEIPLPTSIPNFINHISSEVERVLYEAGLLETVLTEVHSDSMGGEWPGQFAIRLKQVLKS